MPTQELLAGNSSYILLIHVLGHVQLLYFSHVNILLKSNLAHATNLSYRVTGKYCKNYL